MKKFILLLLLCTPAFGRIYTTNFPNTETPISEGGLWVNGGTTGLDWKNMNSTPGFAIGTQVGNESCPTNCNDSTAVVGGSWGSDQTCQITIKVNSAPSSAGVFQEAECRLRTTITAHSITGYEGNCSVSTTNTYIQIIRWNGALGSFTQLNGDGNVHHCVNGDVLKMTAVGSLISVFLNGSLIETATDSTYTSGFPGVGAFTTGGTGINGNFGISSVTLSDTTPNTPWSGIIDSTRAIDWTSTSPGVVGGIPSGSWTQCGATLPAGTSGTNINSALAHTLAGYTSCTSNQYVKLGAGTFNLSTGLIMQSNAALRGSGASSTFLVFSGNANCNGAFTSICFLGGVEYYGASNVQVSPAGSNSATWTAGYTQGATTITLGSVGSNGIRNGQYIMLDQNNVAAVDSTNLFVCDDKNGSPACSSEAGAPGRCSTGGVFPCSALDRNQFQPVKVVSGCASACTGTGPFTITITPGVYGPNYASGKTPGAWWISSYINNSGIEDLSIDSTNNGGNSGINIASATNSWVTRTRNIRSCVCSRDIIVLNTSFHFSVTNNYLFGSTTGGSTTYGIEQLIAGDNLIENNIMQQVNVPVMMGIATGSVVSYNFSVNQAATPTNYFSAMIWEHDASNQYDLYEGNVGPGFTADTYHGNSNFNTLFRNSFFGSQPLKAQNRSAVALWSYNRYHNIIGNVLGTVGQTTTYQSQSGNGGDPLVYNLGGGNGGSVPAISNDNQLVPTTMRWGNYDTVNGANRFVSSEVPSGLSPYGNAVPASQTLPASFYYSARPSWWPSGKAWPPIGPDVTGGNMLRCTSGTYNAMFVSASSQCAGGTSTSAYAGEAYSNPAMDCALATMNMPPDGSGSVLSFDPAVCFAGGTPTVVAPVFSPIAGTYNSTQSVTISTSTSGATICFTADGTTPTANGAGVCTHGTTYTTPVSVSTSQTIKAMGSHSGFSDSGVNSAVYVISVSIPTFSPIAGTYAGAQSVTISTSTIGATICYTTNGSTPTANGAGVCTNGFTYSGAVSVPGSQTLKAIGSLTGLSDSAVSTSAYTITYVLNVAIGGSGAGTITDNTLAINCPGICSASYVSTATITLTAIPLAGSAFTSWSGACSGNGTCILSMSAAQSATATFTSMVTPPPSPTPVMILSNLKIQ